MNNQESLRYQIIQAMTLWGNSCIKGESGTFVNTDHFIERMFDDAIMPVLDKAMKAGELLLHRATTPQKPVDEAVMAFLYSMCASIAKVRAEQDTVSRRELLSILYHLDESAGRAAADANTTRRDKGNPLAGLTVPTKG